MYRTIVADPPWPQKWSGGGRRRHAGLPYQTLELDAIARLDVRALAEDEAHLYLWITPHHNRRGEGLTVAAAWGFEVLSEIVWAKPSYGMGHFPRPQHEMLLVCRRGSLPFQVCDAGSIQTWKQPYNLGKIHSAKPDGSYDLIERASPGPYLELFARRQRLGWDTWGDEALEHVVLESRQGVRFDAVAWGQCLCSARCARLADCLLDGEPYCLGCAELALERSIAVHLAPSLRAALPELSGHWPTPRQVASAAYERRNARARALGYRSYYDYRTHDHGRLPPSAPRPAGEERQRLRGHRSAADLAALVRSGRVELVLATVTDKHPDGSPRRIEVMATLSDGSERTYVLTGKQAQPAATAPIGAAMIAAGIDRLSAYAMTQLEQEPLDLDEQPEPEEGEARSDEIPF